MESLEQLRIALLDNVPQGYVVHSYSVQPFNSGGLHFSSDVKEVKVYMENRKGEKLCLKLISKRLPIEEKQIIVNSKLGFVKEVFFYKHLVPEYHKLQRDHNLVTQNLFSKCYFASDNEILLDDLRQFHFVARKESLDKEHTWLVLQELAKFHSTGVALKLSNPDIFKTTLATAATPALQNEENPNKEEIDKEFRTEISVLLKSMKGFEIFTDSVDSLLSKIDKTKLPSPCEPYATLLHNDIWNGNILFKYSPNNEPIELKFVDFQTTIYNSPARDLVYFLFTSVKSEVLNEFTDLISFYHSFFVHYLSSLGFDVLEFSFERLMNEITIFGPTKLKHMIKLFKTRSSDGEGETTFELEVQHIITMFHERGWI